VDGGKLPVEVKSGGERQLKILRFFVFFCLRAAREGF
jgi:hypothetical protein